MHLERFLREVVAWAETDAEVHAVALVGSHARSAATESSDVDLVVLLRDPSTFLHDTTWTERFGPVSRQSLEQYGRVTSVRVWYADGREVEFGLTDDGWSALPLDEGTRRVVADGMRVLFERDALLSRTLARDGPA